MNIVKLSHVLSLFTFCVILPTCLFNVIAADFYFDSVAGSDTLGDGTQTKPWKSIVKIQATVQCNAGATLHLKTGSEWNANDLDGTTPCGLNFSYAGDGLAIYQSGISLISYGTGEKPRFINPRPGDTNAKTILVQGSNTTIDGLMIDDRLSTAPAPVSGPGVTTNTANGIYMYQGTNNVIKNNEIKNVGEGVILEGSNNFVTNNYIHNLQMVVNTNNNGNDDSGAVGVLVMRSNNEISFNTLQNCRAASYDFGPTYRDGGALEVYAKTGTTIQGNYVHHNIATDNEGFIEFGGQQTGAVGGNIFSYNLLKNEGRLFYFNLSGTFALASVSNLGFYHNTVVDTVPSLYSYYIAASTSPTTNILTMKNNIFYFDNSLVVSQFSNGITHTNNAFYQYNGLTSNAALGFTADSTDVLQDPVFTNTASDYTLTSSSPAIDVAALLGNTTRYNGSSIAIQTTDLAGTLVPVGSGPDIGAYEFTLLVTPTPTTTPTVTPTPSPTVMPSATPTPTATVIPSPTPTVRHGKK